MCREDESYNYVDVMQVTYFVRGLQLKAYILTQQRPRTLLIIVSQYPIFTILLVSSK